MGVAWSDHDERDDRAEAYGEAVGIDWYDDWQQDDDVFARLTDAINESARLNAELAETLRLIA